MYTIMLRNSKRHKVGNLLRWTIFFVTLLSLHSPVFTINRPHTLLPFFFCIPFTRVVLKALFLHPSKHDINEVKVHNGAFTYATMVGSNFSLPLPRTLDLTLVSSSMSRPINIAAKWGLFLALVKTETISECDIYSISLVSTLTSELINCRYIYQCFMLIQHMHASVLT